MKRLTNSLALLTFLCITAVGTAQNTEGVSISNTTAPPSKNAMLDIQTSEKGLLMPRVTYWTINNVMGPLHRGNLTSSEDGLIVFVTSPADKYGYWYFDRSVAGAEEWKKLVTSDLGELWKKSTLNPNNINYSGGNVSINGNPNPVVNSQDSEENQAITQAKIDNLDIYPLQVFSTQNENVSVKIGGNVTTKTFEGIPATTGHMNEINCDEGSLDLQFWNGQPVHIGSGYAPTSLSVAGKIFTDEIYGGYGEFDNLVANGMGVESDSTLKTHILNIDNATLHANRKAKFKQLQLYSYSYKEKLNKTEYGYMAQEVQQILPEVVSTKQKKVRTPGTIVNGIKQPDTYTTQDILTIDFLKLSVISFDMVKNLVIENETQKTEIDQLKAQMQTVLNRLEALEND